MDVRLLKIDAERKNARSASTSGKTKYAPCSTAWGNEAAREANTRPASSAGDQGREIGFRKLDELQAAIAAVDARVVDESAQEFEAEAHQRYNEHWTR